QNPPSFPVQVPWDGAPPQLVESGPVVGMQIDYRGSSGGYYVLTDTSTGLGEDFPVIFGCSGAGVDAGLDQTLAAQNGVYYGYPIIFQENPENNPFDPTV